MKKLTSVLLCLVLVLSMLCVNAAAAGADAEVSAVVSDSGKVMVTVKATETTANAKLVVTFDSDYLAFDGCETGFTVYNVKEGEGEVDLHLANATADAYEAGKILAELRFAATGNWDETKLSVTSERLNGVNCGETVTATVAGTGYRFEDVKAGDWFFQAVDNMTDGGYLCGISETHFAPSMEMNRAMLVTVLGRLAGEELVKAETRFTDVPVDSYCSGFVAWADSKGIASGISETLFGPENSVTREQMVTMLYRYATVYGVDVTVENPDSVLDGYADADKLNDWARDPMIWAVDRGIVTGTDIGLQPQAVTNRAQVAVMLNQFLGN